MQKVPINFLREWSGLFIISWKNITNEWNNNNNEKNSLRTMCELKDQNICKNIQEKHIVFQSPFMEECHCSCLYEGLVGSLSRRIH